MKSFKSIFSEYQDPKVFRDMKRGFIALILTGILVGLVASPPVRDIIESDHPAISQNQALPDRQRHVRSPQSDADGQNRIVKGDAPSNTKGDSNGHGKGSPTSPGIPSNPTAPPTPQPTSPGGPSNPDTPSPGGGSAERPGPTKPVVTVPVLPIPAPVNTVVDTVNDTVNNTTGTVNQITNQLPAQANVPRVCVLNPC